MSITYKIANTGCGGFLAPPNHPTKDKCIEEYEGSELVGIYSIEHTDRTNCDSIFMLRCLELIDIWKESKLAINCEETEDWIHQVLGYFRGGYGNPNIPEPERWNVSNLEFDNRDPLINFADSAGVHCIRKFYPEYIPIKSDFDNAYWGERKENNHGICNHKTQRH